MPQGGTGQSSSGPWTHPAQPLLESEVIMNDPLGRQAVADIIDSQHIGTSVWTLPDGWEIRREPD